MDGKSERHLPSDFETAPLTRSEYIQAMVHFYRGEVSRTNVWRQRLDTTTNWAVAATAAMLTFTFSGRENTHLLLLLTNFILLGFLWMEARRYRIFAVYRARVRMLEENFLLPIVTRHLESPRPDWRELIAMDLDVPKYKNSLLAALAVRVHNNYFWVFSTVYFAWLLKLWIHPTSATSLAEMYAHAALPPLPGWVPLAGATLFYAAICALFEIARFIPALSEEEFRGVEHRAWKP